MQETTHEEQMVMTVLADMQRLFAEIAVNPLKYEEHLSAVEDIMSTAIQAKVAIVRTMAVDSQSETDNIKLGAL